MNNGLLCWFADGLFSILFRVNSNARENIFGEMMMKSFYSIKEVAEITHLSAHTLRFYEKEGLIYGIARNQNGYRQYTSFDLDWIEFLLHVKATNMPLDRIKIFADLVKQGNFTIPERTKILLAHKVHLLKELERFQMVMNYLDAKLLRYQNVMKQDEGLASK